MNKDEIKAKLDELKVEYDPNSNKDVLKKLLDQNETQEETQPEEEQQEETQTSLLDVVSKAVVKEVKTEVAQNDNVIDELKSRPYGTLTRGQRELLRQNSPEHTNVDGGTSAKLNDRLATQKRVVKNAESKWVTLFKDKTYSFNEQDYNLLKDAQVRVKTEATKHKCCGSAVYESVPLLVEVDA